VKATVCFDWNQERNIRTIRVFFYEKLLLQRDFFCEVILTIAMAEAAFNKKSALCTSTLDLQLRKKLVKCYIWSIALYGAETWTIRAVDQKHLASFEMCWISIHFLARCSIFFFKPLKEKLRSLSVQPGLRGSNDLRVGRKMATFQ